MLLHRERGLGCTLRLSMEIQPLGCCFDGCVWRLCLLVASVPSSPSSGRDGACLPLDHVVRCSSVSVAVVEFGCPGVLCWSLVRFTLRQLESSRSRWLLRGFLPPTAGRSFIGGTSACSRPLLRVTAISSLRAGDCGLPLRRWVHERVLMAACLPLLRVWRTAPSHIPLMLCVSTGIYFRSILASSRISFVWVFGGLVQVFSCLALSVPVGVRSGFAPADFSSLWFSLVERI